MHILITNHALDAYAGTEMYVRDLACALKDKGHKVSCYSPKLGKLAQELRDVGIEVVDDPRLLARKPDIIHAHHYTATAPALLAFPGTPAIFVCHGILPWPETPLIRFSQVRSYVAVDLASRERLVNDLGVTQNEVRIIQNGVDTKRFFTKHPPATDPVRRSKALVFSNQAQDSSIGVLREACESNGITLDVRGSGVGNPAYAPENVLSEYGLVFAKARAAMEAMACGAVVILADYGKWGGAIRAADFDTLRLKNFGLQAITRELDATAIADEIASLDWNEGGILAGLVSKKANLDQMVSSLLTLYEDVRAQGNVKAGNGHAEAAAFLHALAPRLYERDDFATRLYEETKIRLGNEATSAALLVEAMVNIANVGNVELAQRLAHHVLFLQPGHPIAEAILKDS